MLYKFSVRVCILLFKYIQSKKLLINTYKNAELRKCSFSCRIHDNDNKIIYFSESYVLASSGVCRLRQVSLIFSNSTTSGHKAREAIIIPFHSSKISIEMAERHFLQRHNRKRLANRLNLMAKI